VVEHLSGICKALDIIPSIINNTTDLMVLTGIYRIFPTGTECTFFSAVHAVFAKLNKIQMASCILSDYNGI
jgi:hypothetical protein